MKVAELYAELGITIKDPAQVKAFEDALTNMAAQAKSLVASLQTLAGIKMPRQATAPTPAAPAAATAAPPAAVATPPPAAAPPLKAPNTAAAGNTAVAQSFKSIATFAKQLVGLGSLAYIIKRLISGFVEMTKTAKNTSFATDKFGKATGLSREELLRWQYAAKAANVEEDAMRETLSALAQQAFEIRFGQHQEAATLLAGWGLDLQQTADKVLEQFGRSMGNRSLNEALMVGKYAGISPEIAYMMHANKGIIPQLTPGQALDNKQQAASLAMGQSINALGTAVTALSNKIVSEASPAITEMVKGLTAMTQLLHSVEGRAAVASMLYLGMPGGVAPAIPFSAQPSPLRQSGQNTYNTTNNIQIDGARDPKVIQQQITNARQQVPLDSQSP